MADNPRAAERALDSFFGFLVCLAGPLAAAILCHHTSFSTETPAGWSRAYVVYELAPVIMLWLVLALNAARGISGTPPGRGILWLTAAAISAAAAALFQAHERVQAEAALMLLTPAAALAFITWVTRRKEYLLSASACVLLLDLLLLFELPVLREPRNVRSFAAWGDAVTFRYLFPERAPYFGSGGRLAPDVDAALLQPHWYPRTVRLRTDSRGFRSHGDIPPAGSVLLLGDSFALGDGADQDSFFGASLERSLKDATGKAAPVLSAEVSNLARGIMYLQEHGAELKPSLVMYGYYGGNDLVQDYADSALRGSPFVIDGPVLRVNPGYDRAAVARFNQELSASLLLEPAHGHKLDAARLSAPGTYTRVLELGILRAFFSAAEMGGLISRGSEGELLPSRALDFELKKDAKSAFENETFPAFFLKQEPPDLTVMYIHLARELPFAREAARNAGGRFVLVYIPHRLEVQPADREAFLSAWGLDPRDFDWDRPARRFQETAAEAGVDVIDLTPALREAAQKRQLYFWRDIHWNEAGQAVAGGFTAAKLHEGGFLE